MIKIIKKFFKIFNVGILHDDRLEQLKDFQKDILSILELPKRQLAKIIEIQKNQKHN